MTAVGKSSVALEVASRLGDVEIVSIDSMQVYRGMDIGTDKVSVEDRQRVPHHLIDILEPDEECSLSWFRDRFDIALAEIEGRGRRALLVGGTALYLRAAIDRLEIPGRFPGVRAEFEGVDDTEELHRRLAVLDPVAAGRMEPTNRRRVTRALEVTLGSGRPFSSYGPGLDIYPGTEFGLVGLWAPLAVVDQRIGHRCAKQLESGFVEEVRSLAGRPGGLSRTARQALGYKEVLAHVECGLALDEALEMAVRRTRRFARRQRAWYRRDPRIWWYGHTGDPGRVVDSVIEHWTELIDAGHNDRDRGA